MKNPLIGLFGKLAPGYSRMIAWICAVGFGFSGAAQTIPFVLPWNDSLPGVTDLSGLNRPITTNRVSADTNGHFVAGGERIRFLGVNFASDSPFAPTNNADAMAARLAKFGVNNVRFHHMDAAWAYRGGLLSYTSTSSTNINASQLERLHFMVSRLKAHGIYSDINLLVGREYRSGDGLGAEVTAMDWKDAHVLGFFYEPALGLHKDYATKVLSPTNRFTGLPLAKDPAVAFVEIINENGVLQKWLDGGLDKLASRYATNLQARWNQWLAARYTSDAQLQSAWGIVDQALGTNALKNGAFSNALTSWNTEQHDTARASFARTFDFAGGQPSARIMVTNADATSWHIQFNQAGLRLISNQVYTVSFWAKASVATNASAAIMRAYGDYAVLGYNQQLPLATNWQFFTRTFQAPVNESNARINFGDMGNKAVTFWFADVRFQSGGQLGTLPDGASIASRTIPNIMHDAGFTGTSDARRDWVRFMRDLETTYYDEMSTHIRVTLGYRGLIFGTIMANSPATVQSRLDVIDSHAYWQHPQFPGQPWDSVNWYVPNISLVNTLGSDNTLPGLARQRIQGKPFTVTEYQHPSPAYYGAEGPVLLALYGALQDWDGLWLFDYGHGNDTVPMGYVRGFFDTAQHTTKMANLLLAANIFRRGDIQAAQTEFTMALTPDREVDLLVNANAWGVFSSSQLGVPAKLAFTNRLSTAVGQNAEGLTTAPSGPTGNNLVSETGELRWSLLQAGKGLVTYSAERTKGFVGFADGTTVNLGAVTVRPGTTKLGWCTFGITLKRGLVLTNDCSALVVATGWWENTGQVWTSAEKSSVGNQWGRAPILTEVVPFEMTLPVGTNYVRVWALDPQGQRTRELPLSGNSTSTTLVVSTNAGTIWYELEVSRWTASYDQWRVRYFSQGDPALGAESATPFNDGTPNLIKYYMGLPGDEPAPAGRRPSASLVADGQEQYLTISLDRDKAAADVLMRPQLSTNLTAWFAADAFTLQETSDLGVLERVTFRDLTPAAADPQRFLRLLFERRN